MIIATAGHIDHGKTTLIAALTGIETDRLPEEKTRGMTIDLGFAYQPLDDGPVLGFIDVPGHEKFIRNMLAGVTGIDFALLVIAADDGPMAQTREHLAILDLLGIEAGAVALTKTDLVDAGRASAVSHEIKNLLAATCLAGAPVFAVSGATGDGVDKLRDHLQNSARQHRSRSSRGHFRLAIDRCFTISGAGLVVTGTAFSGQVRVGDKLVISPENLEVRVRAIHAQNQDSDAGHAGQRLGINITGAGVSREHVHRGDWLVAEAAHAPTGRLDARVRVCAGETRALRHWLPVHVHLGSAEVTARMAVLGGKNIPPGADGWVQLVLDREIGAIKGDKFILRDSSAQRTIGGGVIVDPFAPKRGRARPERLEALARLQTSDPAQALAEQLPHAATGMAIPHFRRIWNLTHEELSAVLGAVERVEAGVGDAAVAFAPGVWSALLGETLGALDQGHHRHPDKPGLEEEALRRFTRPRLGKDVFRSLLDHLLASGEVLRNGPYLLRPGHRAEMAPTDRALWSGVSIILEEGGLRPPVVHDIARTLGKDAKAMEKFLLRAERFGVVTRIASNRFYLPEFVREMADIAEALAAGAADAQLSVIAFRDNCEIGRNLAVEVLEYFDRAGFTRRQGDGRVILRPAGEVFPASSP